MTSKFDRVLGSVPDYQISLECSFATCDLLTRDYGNEQLHLITITGTFDLANREAVFRELLKINRGGHLFYILDNRGNHEIQLAPEDMSHINKLLSDAGIHYVRGAVVTRDDAYSMLISMANAKAKAANLDVELTSTALYNEAEDFVLSKLLEKQER